MTGGTRPGASSSSSKTRTRSAALVKAYLEQQDGWRVLWLRSGEEALAELRRHAVRIVVLDIGLPGIDGFEVCRRMRAHSKVPIVMLTARDEEPDRVAGLELGADDYVLEAVLAARARRAHQGDPAPRREPQSRTRC